MGSASFKIENSSSEKNQNNFYSENFSHYLSFACHYIVDEDISKDIVQDAFISYWKQQDHFEDELSVKSFLYKTIRNACLNQLRHNSIRIKYLNSLPEDWESEDFFMGNVIQEEVSTIILKELDQLSETGRQIILRSLEGFSNEEIANELNISINTVKTHKARSYATLRKHLEYLRLLSIFLINSHL
ncbi:MAG: sigma-70 family RNA polymerase sigma factor [Odoribacter sp.]